MKLLLALLLSIPLLAEPTILPYGVYPPEIANTLPLTPPELRKTGYMVYTVVPSNVKAVLFTIIRNKEVHTQVTIPIDTPNGRIAGATFPIGINQHTPEVVVENLVRAE